MKKACFFLPLFLYASIQSKIINFYKKEYPNIIIEKISSTPALPKKYKKIKLLLNKNMPYGNVLIDNKYYYIRIKAKLPVFITTTIIKQDSPIIKNVNVIKKEVDFRYFYSKPLEKIPKNLIASKIISKNSIITKSNTKIAPAVFRNQTVSVILNDGAIQISSSAKALQDGNIGDIIKIQMNRKIFNAKVIKKGVVTIE